MDHLPEVKWPRSDKFWLGGLHSLHHLLLMEIKRTGRKRRWSELIAVCWASHSFTHLSPLAPPFTPCFSSSGLLMAPDRARLFLSFCTPSSRLEFMYSTLFSSLNSKIPFKHHLLMKPPWHFRPNTFLLLWTQQDFCTRQCFGAEKPVYVLLPVIYWEYFLIGSVIMYMSSLVMSSIP